MSVELRPMGVACNIACQYCYQHPQRDANGSGRAYDMERMKLAVEREGGPFILFGGEPLLLPDEDLKELWSWGLAKFGSNGVQTNGTLISDRHIELFKTYRVHVGVSLDGPGALNDARWVGTLERTRAATAQAEAALARLCHEGLSPSVIVTLHRTNAVGEKLDALCEWLLGLDALGVGSVRLHVLEVDHPAVGDRYELSDEENIAALRATLGIEPSLRRMRLDVFRDLEALLVGHDEATSCVWRACDPLTTTAVRGVEGQGQRSNCGRTNKDGIEFVKTARSGYERSLALYHTPQEWGGCSGCRFFVMCKGQCPGTAVDGDWRNRTRHCRV